MAHTPGPWKIVEGPPANVPGVCLSFSPGWTVYTPDDLNPNGHVQIASYTGSEANARLIAAAPKLLEAAEAGFEYGLALKAVGSDPDQVDSVRASQGETLFQLYEKWIRLVREAIAMAAPKDEDSEVC